MTKRKPQHVKIVNHLAKNKRLTVREALSRYGVQNLRARIRELRIKGYNIATLSKSQTGRVTVYRLNA